jgi:hypothetical protein
MNFDNPVYRKTTTDHQISIEKNRGFHKTYPATITEEVQATYTYTCKTKFTINILMR